jgi:hypothetical protein
MSSAAAAESDRKRALVRRCRDSRERLRADVERLRTAPGKGTLASRRGRGASLLPPWRDLLRFALSMIGTGNAAAALSLAARALMFIGMVRSLLGRLRR